MSNSWFSGEYLAARIIITIILIFIAFWIFLLCCKKIRVSLIELYKRCFYKTASIVPTQEATITTDPITSYAKEIPLNPEIIIL